MLIKQKDMSCISALTTKALTVTISVVEMTLMSVRVLGQRLKMHDSTLSGAFRKNSNLMLEGKAETGRKKLN